MRKRVVRFGKSTKTGIRSGKVAGCLCSARPRTLTVPPMEESPEEGRVTRQMMWVVPLVEILVYSSVGCAPGGLRGCMTSMALGIKGSAGMEPKRKKYSFTIEWEEWPLGILQEYQIREALTNILLLLSLRLQIVLSSAHKSSFLKPWCKVFWGPWMTLSHSAPFAMSGLGGKSITKVSRSPSSAH